MPLPRSPVNADVAQPDTVWRNRDQFLKGREEVVQFLAKKWEKENGYRLRKELFAFTDNKIAVQVRGISIAETLHCMNE